MLLLHLYPGVTTAPPSSLAGSFPRHDETPLISDGRFNPQTDEGEIDADTFREKLIRAHGVFMIVAWPVLAVTGIFFAAWMKPALPNGEWFQVSPQRSLLSL